MHIFVTNSMSGLSGNEQFIDKTNIMEYVEKIYVYQAKYFLIFCQSIPLTFNLVVVTWIQGY